MTSFEVSVLERQAIYVECIIVAPSLYHCCGGKRIQALENEPGMELGLVTNAEAVSGCSVCEMFMFQAADLKESLTYSMVQSPS